MSEHIPTGNDTGVSTSTTYTNYCSSRLPCGICRLTNAICPMWNGSVTPTWSPIPVCGDAETGIYVNDIGVYGRSSEGGGKRNG